MKADKREIVTFVIAALDTLVAVWFFLGKMQKEKDTERTDLYTLVAPASDAILSVKPVAYTHLYQYDIHTSLIDQLSHRIIVSCQHGNFLPTLFHFYQAMCGHLSICLLYTSRCV